MKIAETSVRLLMNRNRKIIPSCKSQVDEGMRLRGFKKSFFLSVGLCGEQSVDYHLDLEVDVRRRQTHICQPLAHQWFKRVQVVLANAGSDQSKDWLHPSIARITLSAWSFQLNCKPLLKGAWCLRKIYTSNDSIKKFQVLQNIIQKTKQYLLFLGFKV